MKFKALLPIFLAAVPAAACGQSSAAEDPSCPIYRSFYKHLPAKPQQAFIVLSSPEAGARRASRLDAQVTFERGDGLLEPPPGDFEPDEFVADVSPYLEQVGIAPAIDISDCFQSGGPEFFDEVNDDIIELIWDNEVLAVWTFSPVAFSPDGQRAAVIGGFFCGGLCGGGALYLFERSGSEWVIIGNRTLWIS